MLFCEACENATHQPAVLMWAAGQAGFSFSRFSVRFAVKRVPTGIFARALRPADERVGRAWKETMLRLTDEELSRVQDLCRMLPPCKARRIFARAARRASSAVSILSSGTPRLSKKDRRRRVVDKEDPWSRLAASDAPPCLDGAPAAIFGRRSVIVLSRMFCVDSNSHSLPFWNGAAEL